MRSLRSRLVLLLLVGSLAVGGAVFGGAPVTDEEEDWRAWSARVVDALFGLAGDEEPPPEDENDGGGMIDPNG